MSGPLHRLYQSYKRWILLHGISLSDYDERKPKQCYITTGFGADFGDGKSPFKIYGVIRLSDSVLHILLDTMNFKKVDKWERRIKTRFRVKHVIFYDSSDDFELLQWMDFKRSISNADN